MDRVEPLTTFRVFTLSRVSLFSQQYDSNICIEARIAFFGRTVVLDLQERLGYGQSIDAFGLRSRLCPKSDVV